MSSCMWMWFPKDSVIKHKGNHWKSRRRGEKQSLDTGFNFTRFHCNSFRLKFYLWSKQEFWYKFSEGFLERRIFSDENNNKKYFHLGKKHSLFACVYTNPKPGIQSKVTFELWREKAAKAFHKQELELQSVNHFSTIIIFWLKCNNFLHSGKIASL